MATSNVDQLANTVAIKRRELESAILALYQRDKTVGLGALEHSTLMLEKLKEDIRADEQDAVLEDTLAGRIADAQARIAARPAWLKGS